MDWIPIEVELPEDDQKVLVYDEGTGNVPRIAFYKCVEMKEGFYNSDLTWRLVVSHWLPIPDQPK